MSNIESNNKRIAKNTLLLYMRTFITIIVSLYTSRVVLSTLGETDFGIYNIVGGVVVLFSFIQMALASATQRFLNFEMGSGNAESVKKVFSVSMTSHIFIALLLLLLAETVGLWVVMTQLNIPQEREFAAFCVYQFSIITTCISIIRVPYHAAIIANERMGFYAYLSVIETVAKLLIVYLLLVVSSDKLILYGILICVIASLTLLCYKIYCNRTFKETQYKYVWDKPMFTQLISFSGWSLFGAAANVGATQGLNIFINIFDGVVANAAMGIANQVKAAIGSFSANFQTAFNPQLVKSYAAKEYNYFIDLICQTSKLSFILVYLMTLPLIISIDTVLDLWLGEYPMYTAEFIQWILIYLLIDALSSPLWMSVQATGKIKKYQLLMSFLIALNIPVAYVLLYCGYSPVSVLVCRVAINFITHITRIFYLQKHISLPVKRYLLNVMGRTVLLIMLTIPLPYWVYSNTKGIGALFLTILVSTITIGAATLLVALNRRERKSIFEMIKMKIRK